MMGPWCPFVTSQPVYVMDHDTKDGEQVVFDFTSL